eukprot:1452412-Prymnesium_polylepis.1
MRTSARVWVAKSALTFVKTERLRVKKRRNFPRPPWGCAPALACASRLLMLIALSSWERETPT